MSRRRAKRHGQDKIPIQEQAGASPRNDGRVVPWRNIFVVILQALSLGTILALWVWNTELETQLNRSETRAANLTSDLSASQRDQLRLGTNITARDRELAETKRELLHSDQHLHTCGSLNEQLNNTVHLIADSAADALNERNAAVQRAQRQTDLLLACEANRRYELKDRLAGAERENEKKARDKERWHQQQGSLAVQNSGLQNRLLKVGKKVLLWTGKLVIGIFSKHVPVAVAGVVMDFLSGLQ